MAKRKSEQEMARDSLIDCIAGFLVIFVVVGICLYGPNPFIILHDIGESTGTGVLPFIAFIIIIIASCVILAWYGTKK